MDELIPLFAIVAIIIGICVAAQRKEHTALIIVLTLVATPLIGFLAYLMLPTKRPPTPTYPPQNPYPHPGSDNTGTAPGYGRHSEDPQLAWERQQRALTPPPLPRHRKK